MHDSESKINEISGIKQEFDNYVNMRKLLIEDYDEILSLLNKLEIS